MTGGCIACVLHALLFNVNLTCVRMGLKLHNKYYGIKYLLNVGVNKPEILRRCLSSRSAEAIFLEKTLEDPLICVTEKQNIDVIGPPDPVSNLRPVIRKRMLCETSLSKQLRELQEETQAWNQEFWATHNTNFIKEKNEFIKQNLKPSETKSTLTADEMSEFYKAFLDKNWKTHVTYNVEWYKRNFRILFLSLCASIEGLGRNI